MSPVNGSIRRSRFSRQGGRTTLDVVLLAKMIKSWTNRASERFYTEDRATPFRGLDVEAAQDLLAALDAAISLQDLSPLRSVGLHKLKGDRSGQWAMTVNGPWRICFRFKDGDAYGVEIVDYHRG